MAISTADQRFACNTVVKKEESQSLYRMDPKLKEIREEIIGQLEKHLKLTQSPEDDLFYYHPSEDRIVLSHALFLVMTASTKGKIAKEKVFLLLRTYQEEMLEAWLTESPDFPALLHYCNVLYNSLPIILRAVYNLATDRNAGKLAATCIVAGGYGGDMAESQADELLDDMDFYYNKVKCRKIEELLPTLTKLVDEELMVVRGLL